VVVTEDLIWGGLKLEDGEHGSMNT